MVTSGAIERFPNIIALQSEKCDPLYQARRQGLDHPATVTPTPTMAEGIAIGVPMRGTEILDMMRKHDIKVVTCPEDKILEASLNFAQGYLQKKKLVFTGNKGQNLPDFGLYY